MESLQLSLEAAQDPQRVRVYEKYMEYLMAMGISLNSRGIPIYDEVGSKEPDLEQQSDPRIEVVELYATTGNREYRSEALRLLPWYIVNGPLNRDVYDIAIVRLYHQPEQFFPLLWRAFGFDRVVRMRLR